MDLRVGSGSASKLFVFATILIAETRRSSLRSSADDARVLTAVHRWFGVTVDDSPVSERGRVSKLLEAAMNSMCASSASASTSADSWNTNTNGGGHTMSSQRCHDGNKPKERCGCSVWYSLQPPCIRTAVRALQPKMWLGWEEHRLGFWRLYKTRLCCSHHVGPTSPSWCSRFGVLTIYTANEEEEEPLCHLCHHTHYSN